MNGARSATRHKMSTITAPMVARRLRHSSQAAFLRRCQKRAQRRTKVGSVGSSRPRGERGVGGIVAFAMSVLLIVALCQTNAWVQQAIGEVDEQIHHHEACGEDQYSRLDHGIVAPHDGLIEGEANAWPGKNGLDHHCASQETRKLQTRYCYRRNQGISEGVLVDHPAFRESQGARRVDVLLADFVEHR